jgi:peptidoglycan-associated lipoprotein
MNSTRFLALILTALVAACASTEEQKSAAMASDSSGAQTPGSTIRPTDRQGPSSSRDGTASTPTRPGAPAKNSVYFDYDQFDIKPEYKTVVEDHAKYLRANPALRARIEGNADERGSREYNVALGQRRAEAVMKNLRLLGVQDSRMEAISYGEEKPRRTGHDEASHAENRRGDLVFEAAK